MATITILQKPNSQRKIRVEVNLDQWERLADVFGFYNPRFLKLLNSSLAESKRGRIRKVKSLRELRA